MTLPEILAHAEAICADSELRALSRWKEQGGRVVGCAPAYVPTEIIDAAGALPAHILGAGPSLEVVQGDAFFQSAICHLPRSLVELGQRGALDALDLFVIPSTCDVMRNLVGMWRLLFPDRPVRYLDLPQRFDAAGRAFYLEQLVELRGEIERILDVRVRPDDMARSIALYNRRRRVIRELEDLRTRAPWQVPTSEFVLVLRAGALITPREHLTLLLDYRDACRAVTRPVLDVARVVLTGAFCEQPPLGFIRTLERAGCAIVGDDLLLGMRWLLRDVREEGDPLEALADAYLHASPLAPSRFEGDERRPDALLHAVRTRGAAGVILSSPSFCDPALLDRPHLLAGLEKAGIPSVQLQYAENSADFGSVREQAGTFADALRLWDTPTNESPNNVYARSAR